MLRRFSQNFAILFIIIDSFFVMTALRLAELLRPGMSQWASWIREISSTPQIEWYFYLVFTAVWIIVFISFSIYDPQKNLRLSEELTSLLLACLTVIVIIPGILYFFNRGMSRVMFVTFSVLGSFFLISYRVLLRIGFRNGFFRPPEKIRVLIVGAGVVGRSFGEKLQDFHLASYELIGYVDDDTKLIATNPDVIGNLDDVESIINEKEIQHLIIALPRRAHTRTSTLVRQIHSLPVHVWVIPDYFSLAVNRASIFDFAGFPLIDLRAPALTHFQRLIKRIFDLIITIPLFIVTLPLLLLLAIIIKFDSKGPVLYFSKRIKENGETFEMIKLRTMKVNADKEFNNILINDDEGNPIHKRPDDPRVTRAGRFLRHTSLDELPQLINILRGDMSLVGPRPELPEMVALYEPWQRARFAVPQGLTGWWQVNGRSDKPMHLHTEEDLYYIQHYSIWLDIRILLKTIFVVFKGKGAF